MFAAVWFRGFDIEIISLPFNFAVLHIWKFFSKWPTSKNASKQHNFLKNRDIFNFQKSIWSSWWVPFNFAVHLILRFYTKSRNSQNKWHTNFNGYTVSVLAYSGFPQSWKVMEKSHGMKKSWKVMEKSWNLKISKSHGKVMEFCQKTKIFPLFFLFFQNCRQYLSKIAIFATNKFLIRPSEFCWPWQRVVKSHGKRKIWSWKVMEKSWNFVAQNLWEPWVTYLRVLLQNPTK